MRAVWAIGVVSEILLAVGIALVFYGVGMAVTHPSEICAGSFIGGCSYSLGDVGPTFFVGIALLVFSFVGFLFVLNAARKTPAPHGETST